MSEFDTLLSKYTQKGHAKVHGALAKCVDKNGNVIYSKISGHDSVDVDASPLREDAVMKMASGSKIITSIALLQCIDKGLIGLDEPLDSIVPELKGKSILSSGPDGELLQTPSKNSITVRHLLTHTSGMGYPFTHPLLMKYAMTPEGSKNRESKIVTERYDKPLVFEPGDGWLYGTSLEWAGVVVKRLHGGISLEDYMIEHIWKKVGLQAPYPTFHLSGHPEYKARLMQGAEKDGNGVLQPYEFWQGDNPVDQEGGHGLVATATDYLAVLVDLVSDAPKLMKAETTSLMFTPQIAAGSPAMTMLLQLRPAWEVVIGPISDGDVNHGLGGLLATGPVSEIGQPANILAWGGAANLVWWASRELGVAGFFGTQLNPFGDKEAVELINTWKKDFWSQYRETA